MVRQTSFTTGEVDIVNWKRTDQESLYMSAAQSLQNCEISTTGRVKKRKGTKFLMDVTAYAGVNSNSRMYEFIDKYDRYYLILSANGYFHIFTSGNQEESLVTIDGDTVITIDDEQVVVGDNTLAFVQTITSPLPTTYLNEVDYAQDNDVLIFTHPNLAPFRIYISSYTSPPTFAWEYLAISVYPSYDFSNIDYNNFDVTYSVAGDILTFNFINLLSNPGYTSAWVGGQIIGIGASDLQPIGYANIIAVTPWDGTKVVFTASIQVPFQASGATKGSQYDIRQPAFSAALGYPAKVFFYQSRLWFGATATLATTIFGSQINAPLNFDVGVGRDTDAIIAPIGHSNAGRILWINGGKQLEIYTTNFEFVCPQDENSAITPSTITIRDQSAFGISPSFKPLSYLNDSYYISKTGKSFVNFHFDGVGQSYTSTNISLVSEHLIKRPGSRALQRGTDTSQDNFVYMINDDNTITIFQFAQEYKLAAFTPMDIINTSEDGSTTHRISFIDIASINNDIYVLKYYNLTGKFVIETFVDDIKMDGYVIKDMVAEEINGEMKGVISDLSMYNGYRIQVLFGNQDMGQADVSGGVAIVENPGELEGVVLVGFLYPVTIKPMYVFSGTNETNYYKNISKIYVDYYQSLNFYVNGVFVPYQTFAQIQAGLGIEPQTGTATVYPVGGWSDFSNVTITQNSPYDLQILAIAYQIESAII